MIQAPCAPAGPPARSPSRSAAAAPSGIGIVKFERPPDLLHCAVPRDEAAHRTGALAMSALRHGPDTTCISASRARRGAGPVAPDGFASTCNDDGAPVQSESALSLPSPSADWHFPLVTGA